MSFCHSSSSSASAGNSDAVGPPEPEPICSDKVSVRRTVHSTSSWFCHAEDVVCVAASSALLSMATKCSGCLRCVGIANMMLGACGVTTAQCKTQPPRRRLPQRTPQLGSRWQPATTSHNLMLAVHHSNLFRPGFHLAACMVGLLVVASWPHGYLLAYCDGL